MSDDYPIEEYIDMGGKTYIRNKNNELFPINDPDPPDQEPETEAERLCEGHDRELENVTSRLKNIEKRMERLFNMLKLIGGKDG